MNDQMNDASHSVVLFDDTFNPFHILHFSTDYAAHVVPALSSEALRDDIRTSLSTLTEQQQRHAFFSTGTYVQSSGPRFETKAEISFFRQFGVRDDVPNMEDRRCKRYDVSNSFRLSLGIHWHDWST